jgi:Raf kinase inhibitor-like YbhB/YbcL family protein
MGRAMPGDGRMRRLHTAVSSVLVLILSPLLAAVPESAVSDFQLKSSAFSNGGAIPPKFTCDGPDVSPELSWNGPQGSTKAFALIMDDPDAPGGTWVHWVLYDLRPSVRELPEGVPKTKDLQIGARQGVNDFRRVGYGGPCPPRGASHRYSFRLYALDQPTQLPAGASKGDLERAMQGHILAQADLVGRFQH